MAKVKDDRHINSVDMPNFIFDAFKIWMESSGAVEVVEYPEAVQPDDPNVTAYIVAPKGYVPQEPAE